MKKTFVEKLLISLALCICLVCCGCAEETPVKAAEPPITIQTDNLYDAPIDQTEITYAYWIDAEGYYYFIGRCVGYGIPVDGTESSNVQNYELDENASNALVFQNNYKGKQARWLFVIDEETGKAHRSLATFEVIYVSPVKVDRDLCKYYSLPHNYDQL